MTDILKTAIASTFDLQDKANRVMAGPNWKTNGVDWVTCAVAELGEGIGWTGYKHWKETKHNWHQAFIEIVDSYHFMLSAAIAHGVSPSEATKSAADPDLEEHNAQLVSDFHEAKSLDEQKTQAKKSLKRLARYCLEADGDPASLKHVVAEHLEASAGLGFDKHQFFAAYVPKNTLNLFRQANGDREGNYPRMWEFEGETVEDNQVVEFLTKRDPSLSLDSARLTSELASNLAKFHHVAASKPATSPGI